MISDVHTSLIAGGAASVSVRTVEAPLERVKILLQNQNLVAEHQPYRGALDALRRIPQEQGLASLWRGNFTNCVRAVPSQAFRFTFMDQFQQLARLGMPTEGSSTSSRAPLPLHRQMLSGGLSGAVTMTLIYPLELTRTKLAMDTGRSRRFTGIADCLITTTKEHGLRGNYRGLLISVLEITPYTAIAMGGYEFLKHALPDDESSLSAWWYPFAKVGVGWLSGLTGSLTCYPMDTVKRQLMLDGSFGVQGKYGGSITTCVRTLYHNSGMVGFYRGCGLNAIKGAPAAALTFVLNDYFRMQLGHSRTT